MKKNQNTKQAKSILKGNQLKYWRLAQYIVATLGLLLWTTLLMVPKIGLHAFWNVLIPIAPALVVFASGLWRNICPMASTSLLPRHLGFSKKKRVSKELQEKFHLYSISLLLLIIPLRHVILDYSGLATAIILLILASLAFYLGYNYDWKSGWCSGVCPISSVEKLYGRKSLVKLSNAHCKYCVNCVVPCPDSTPLINPIFKKKKNIVNMSGLVLIGGFPGYIWAWFQVPDYHGIEGWNNLLSIYSMPFMGLILSFSIFSLIKAILNTKYYELLINIFAFLAVSIYYWFRIPALIGFGKFPNDGRLVDLSQSVSASFPFFIKITLLLLFFWWFFIKTNNNLSWVLRPPYFKNKPKLQLSNLH